MIEKSSIPFHSVPYPLFINELSLRHIHGYGVVFGLIKVISIILAYYNKRGQSYFSVEIVLMCMQRLVPLQAYLSAHFRKSKSHNTFIHVPSSFFCFLCYIEKKNSKLWCLMTVFSASGVVVPIAEEANRKRIPKSETDRVENSFYLLLSHFFDFINKKCCIIKTLFLGHCSLIKNKTQTAVINIINLRIFYINLTFRMLVNVHFQK